jgi:hypothetical protein
MERQLGDVATRILFENERVRVWEMQLAPGERSATHCHQRDYVLVQIDGDRIAAQFEPDTGGALHGYVEGAVEPGKTRFFARGGVETAINVGKRAYREILIELK